jgi:hypothetical protein
MSIVKSLFNWLTGQSFIMYAGGGGGGQPTQSTSTAYQTNIPEYAKPYVETMLGATQKQLFQGTPTEGGGFDITGFQPYKAYGGTYDAAGNQTSYDPSKGIAGFQPMQISAQQGIADMRLPGEYGRASDATQRAMQNLQGMGYNAGKFANQFQAPTAYQTGQFDPQQLQQYQMGPAERVSTDSFLRSGVTKDYMSPYMQNVVNAEKREARRDSDITRQAQQAQAANAGAFGGARQAIIEAERQRNLGTQLGDIQATGQERAFQNAQQQFNAEQQNRLQARLANQQAGLTVGGQNLAARLGVQQLGAQEYMQGQQMREASRQYGYGQRMNAAQQRAQYGLSAQQLGEQSRQYGAGHGLQAKQATLGAANQLANLGGQRLQAQQGIYGLQNQYGAQQQALQQQILNQAMQDYANAQQYPLMQLGTMSNMIRGLPMQASTTQQYQAQPSLLTQGIGAIGAGTSLYNLFNPPAKAKGGIISYDVGGEVEHDLYNMDEESLQKQVRESSSPTIKRIAQRLLREKQMESQPTGKAGGGIVAFAKGDEVIGPEDSSEARQAAGILLAPRPNGAVSDNPVTPPMASGVAPAAPVLPEPREASIAQVTNQAPPEPQIQDTLANLPPFYKALYNKASETEGKTREEIAKELKKEAGPNVGAQEQRAKLMAERANADDEATRQRWLRAAEFFGRWGSTPGPVLVAGLNAVKESVPSIVSDEKAAKEIRMKIDNSIYELDNATRLEEKGYQDKAEAIKEKQAANMMKVHEFLARAQEDKVKIDAENKKQADYLIGMAQIHHDDALAHATSAAEVARINGNFHKEVANIQGAFGVQQSKISAASHEKGYAMQERGHDQRAVDQLLGEERKAQADIDRVKRDPAVSRAYQILEMSKDPKNNVPQEMISNAQREINDKMGDLSSRLEGIRTERQRVQDRLAGKKTSDKSSNDPLGLR